MKILLRIPISPYTGYGRDGIGMARALMRWGADVYLEPSSVQAPLPEDVAMLLTKPLSAPFDLAIVHLNPAEMKAPDELVRSAAVVIGWTMWEWTDFKQMEGRSKLKKNWKQFDAIVAYDANSQQAIAEHYDGYIPVVQGGFWPEDWPQTARDWHAEDFYFCMVGMLTPRKGPFVAIRAFSELKEEHADFNEHARLSMKTMAPGLHSKMEDVYPGLRIFYDVWDDETMRSFYAHQHVLLAPSQGEGKNMPALEMQSTGGTVIATNWGGHQQWLNPSYNYALDYELQQVIPGKPTMNARASVEHLKTLMLHVFRNRDEAKQKGELAAQIIPGLASWDKVIERLFLALSQGINKDKAERLWILSQMDRQVGTRGDD